VFCMITASFPKGSRTPARRHPTGRSDILRAWTDVCAAPGSEDTKLGVLWIGRRRMEGRKSMREFKLEAVNLIKDRGMSSAQVAKDLVVHPTQLRNWVKALADDPQHSFPGRGQMKPEPGIACLKREVAKLKAERDIPKTAVACFAKEPALSLVLLRSTGDLAGGTVVRNTRCFAGWHLWLADTTAPSARPGAMKDLGAKVRARFVASDWTYEVGRSWRGKLYGRSVERNAPDRAIDVLKGP
jgi:transposase